jgi:hypothetical protein
MDIDDMIDEGLRLVQNDLQHDLSVDFRCRLISRFDESGGDRGRRQRVKLAELGVRKVLPIWESIFPTDQTAHRALELASDLLAGTTSSTNAEKQAGAMWSRCDGLAWTHPGNQSVVMVGYGAIQVIREALSEKHFGCNKVNAQSTERDVDPYDHDSAICAAIAYSGGAAWDQGSDPTKRLAFWTWWLNIAVPAAMENP